jgi:diguanylate cyclase (GGDEF)-like protein
VAKGHPPPKRRRAPKGTGPLIRQVRDLVCSAAEQDDPLRKGLQLLQPVLESDAVVALLFNDQDHTFRITEHCGLSAKQRRGLDVILPSVTESGNLQGTPRVPAKNNGVVLIFTDAESRKSGISSAFVYYIIRSERIVGALAFCKEKGQFDKASLKALDSVASLLAILAENRFYKEKAYDMAGFVNLDGLTGLNNHRYFQENLSNELLKSRRFRYKVSLLMIDVDHFKSFNDKYGHPQGDLTLKEISQIIKKTIRAYDVPARYGGEEFAVVLPHADHDHALRVAERLRRAVLAHPFPGRRARERLNLTVSIGVASYPANARTKAELIDRADQALYLAKSEGRNRVCLSLASSSDLIKVGFCPAAFTSPYYGDVLSGLEDVVKEIKRIELSVRAPEHESDYSVLRKLFRQFVRDKPDAIAICTQSPDAVQDLQILHKANIPVFFFNVPEKIDDAEIRSYVGYDQEEAGKTVGKYLARLLRGRGRLAILEGLPEPTSRLRVAGFRKSLKTFREISLVASERADWSPSLARKATEKILRRHGDLDAIFAVSDAMALGAVKAVKAKGLLGRIFIVGLDGTRGALESVRAGELTATLSTGPREMGRILLRTILRSLIKEEKIARQIYSPINIVTLENVNQALDL